MWLQDYSNPNSLASRLRRRRLERFLALVRDVHRMRGACRILDLGGRVSYWAQAAPALAELGGIEITLVNVEPPDDAQAPEGPVSFVSRLGDACALDYPDAAFDLVHSNSVIEHVGSWPRMEAFAAEARRVGRGLYVQTPAYWFPIEPHFRLPGFALLPRPLQVRLLMARRNGFFDRAGSIAEAMAILESCQLLDRRAMAFLFPDATIEAERFAGLEKSLIAVRPPAA